MEAAKSHSSLLGVGGNVRQGLKIPWLIDAGWRLLWPAASSSTTLKGFFEPQLVFPADEDKSVLIRGPGLQMVKKLEFVVCCQGPGLFFLIITYDYFFAF